MRSKVCALALLAVVLAGSPAAAKEGFLATLSGPGISSPSGIDLPPSPLVRRAGSEAGPVANLDTGSAQILRGGLPGHVGPPYVITFPWTVPNGPSGKFEQHLYPYARGGPVVHIPSGQSFYGERDRDHQSATTFRIVGTPADAFRWLGFKNSASAADLLPDSGRQGVGLDASPATISAQKNNDEALRMTGLLVGSFASAVLVGMMYRRRSQ